MKNNKYFWLVPISVVLIVLSVIGLAHLFNPPSVGEQASNAGYLRKTVGLITDAPHATAELFYSTIENLVILAAGLAWGKRLWRKEHKKFDEEHGVKH
jgi:hypothetical protein